MQEDPFQNACDFFSLCKSKWALQSKSYNLNQRQRRERTRIMNMDRGYIGADTDGSKSPPCQHKRAHVRADKGRLPLKHEWTPA